MSSQAIVQRFRVSRGGCWQCVPDCRIRLAEVLTFSQVAYNGPQVAEGGYTQTLKRSTDMDNETNISSEEQTGSLQQPAVMGSFVLVSHQEPPRGRELLARSPEGTYHLCHWREAYMIFTVQSKGDSSLDWMWVALPNCP